MIDAKTLKDIVNELEQDCLKLENSGFEEDVFFVAGMKRAINKLENLLKSEETENNTVSPYSWEDAFNSILDNQRDLAYSKDTDYGPDNIAESGIICNLGRIQDKWNRVKNLTGFAQFQKSGCDLQKFVAAIEKGEIKLPEINHESLDDTYADLVNYFIYMRMLSKGLWLLTRRRNLVG